MARRADWDASTYHRVAQPHAAWGASVLERIELRGDEDVLDAGCGSGKVTAQLLERLPHGHLFAADQSPAMLAEARTTLAPYAERVTFLQTDLLDIDRSLRQKVNVVFSTAVFHWIADHPRLFAALRGVMHPHARLVAQCGGAGNLASFMRATDAVAARVPFAHSLGGRDLWRYYATPAETQARLQSAGFSAAEAWLEPSPQVFADPHALADFARTVVLSSHVAELPDPVRDDFVKQVVQEIARREGRFSLDYVRLNIQASA
jgi:trans-aconitate 2-methyltransferase